MGCRLWGCTESDTTERLHFHFSLSCIGEGNGNPLQCSCLENPRDSGAWWAAVYGVAQSRLSSSSSRLMKVLRHPFKSAWPPVFPWSLPMRLPTLFSPSLPLPAMIKDRLLFFPGEGNGNPLQYSCLENPRDSGAWWAAVYGVTQSRTQLKRLSSSSSRGIRRRQWHPTPVLLPRKSHGRGSLLGCRLWGRTEST